MFLAQIERNANVAWSLIKFSIKLNKNAVGYNHKDDGDDDDDDDCEEGAGQNGQIKTRFVVAKWSENKWEFVCIYRFENERRPEFSF